MQLNEMIKELCKAGMSQNEIAKHLNVNQSTISRCLNNHHDMSYKKAKKLEQLYMEVIMNKQ